MTRVHLASGVFVAVLVAIAGLPALSTSPEPAAPPPAPVVALSAPAADLTAPADDDALCSADAGAARAAGDLSPVPEAEEAACSRCPDGSPSCWSDKQCDSVCGGKGTGVCERINSCYKCCLCAL